MSQKSLLRDFRSWNHFMSSKRSNKMPTIHRPLYEIAREIRKDWGSKVNYAAKPYLDAMETLDKITDNYMMDSGMSIVLYFLSNANTWRGETAKKIKKELKLMANSKG